MNEQQQADSPAISRDANQSASVRRCSCGRVLAAPRWPGPARVTCSAACKAKRDAVVRKLRRRQAALRIWRAHVGGSPGFPAAVVADEIAALEREIPALLRALQNDQPLDSVVESEPGHRGGTLRHDGSVTLTGSGSARDVHDDDVNTDPIVDTVQELKGHHPGSTLDAAFASSDGGDLTNGNPESS